MLAHMHHGIDRKRITQPEVEGQVMVRRHQFGVVVLGVIIAAIERTRGLDADEHMAQLHSGHHEPAIAQHRILLGRAPSPGDGIGHALRQLRQALAVGLQ
ncbi:hypothetical protein D3C72_1993010 [compost metagenome]